MSFDYLATYQKLLSIAKAGQYYGHDAFDQERYQSLEQLALELISQVGHEPVDSLRLFTQQEQGYPTPKVDVRALILKEQQILLVQDRKTSTWSLPGGYSDIGLSPKENIAKEVLEETGLRLSDATLLAVFDTLKRKDIPQLFQYYKLVFFCTVEESPLPFTENLETSAIGYFSLSHLPALSKERTTYEQLHLLMELALAKTLPFAYCD
ncbi:MAG: NUDIX hydrolase [Clostridiales bacterium]|nr:NUDIX hydrolase [Clostridiales bacterium]